MESNFSEYKPEELVGKLVLYEHGMAYNPSYSKAIRKITKVTKTGFRISDMDDRLFSLSNGNQKGLNSRQDVGVHSICYLITEEEAQAFRTAWTQKKLMKGWIEEIQKNLPALPYHKLEKIIQIIADK